MTDIVFADTFIESPDTRTFHPIHRHAETTFLAGTIMDDGEGRDRVTGAELIADNADDEDVIAFVRSAEVGDTECFGHSTLERIA